MCWRKIICTKEHIELLCELIVIIFHFYIYLYLLCVQLGSDYVNLLFHNFITEYFFFIQAVVGYCIYKYIIRYGCVLQSRILRAKAQILPAKDHLLWTDAYILQAKAYIIRAKALYNSSHGSLFLEPRLIYFEPRRISSFGQGSYTLSQGS